MIYHKLKKFSLYLIPEKKNDALNAPRDLNEFKFKNGFPGLNVSSFFAFNLVLTGKTA